MSVTEPPRLVPSLSSRTFVCSAVSPEPRSIPWRIVHDLDDTPHPVSRGAADYIDRIMGAPIIALSALAPRSLARSEPLQQVMQLRARIADLLEAVAVNAADLERRGAAVPRSSAASTASGDDDTAGSGPAWVLSEQPTPLRNAVRTSPAAAAAFRDCSRVFCKTVGDRLAFMAESVELLPLSLIVCIDEDGHERVTPRLAAAARAIEQYAVTRGLLARPNASRGADASPS